MRYTLICSASGTGLSGSVRKLIPLPGPKPEIVVEDVEKRLCSNSPLWALEAFGAIDPASRSMADVCSKLPRAAVSSYWRQALRESLETLDGCGDSALALACHLTLFSPNRREFYIPGRPQDFLDAGRGRQHEVARVVVLIDDIYDMYARLSGPHGVYNEEQQTRNYADWVFKLSRKALLDPKSGSPELLKFEVRRRSLESLAALRRAELLQAEALAHSLGDVPLTVLGVKHHLAVLREILLSPGTQVAYLSHKITEARKANKATPRTWPPFVAEVNALSAPFLQAGTILLHPTAIDELRTSSSEGTIGLTDRWPLQADIAGLIYSPPAGAGTTEYSELFSNYDFTAEDTTAQAVALFRGFELGVFHDIATRDHLLVSSTDGLVLYRPVVLNGEDSSGARAEVQHWLQRWLSEPSGPRMVAMHTFEDIDRRLLRISPDERVEFVWRMRESLQEQGFDSEQARAMVDGVSPPSMHLLELSGAEDLNQELENAAGIALGHCFLSWLCNVRPSEGRTGATLVAAKSAEELRSPALVTLVTALLRGQADAVSTSARFLVSYAQARGHHTLTSLARQIMNPAAGSEDPSA